MCSAGVPWRRCNCLGGDVQVRCSLFSEHPHYLPGRWHDCLRGMVMPRWASLAPCLCLHVVCLDFPLENSSGSLLPPLSRSLWRLGKGEEVTAVHAVTP